MKVSVLLSGGIVLLCAACAGPGEKYPVALSYLDGTPVSPHVRPPEKVAVFPLQDERGDGNSIGRRVHLFGQVDTFESASAVAPRVTELLISALRHRGWEPEAPPAGAAPRDVFNEHVLTGAVKVLRADATSHWGYTQIDARFSLYAEILDPMTGRKMTFAVDDQSSPKVFIFRPGALEESINELVSESLRRVPVSGATEGP